MHRGELDLAAREWRLPAERTKNAHAHLVPLSRMAIGIIEAALADAGKGDAVFPCGRGSLSPVAVARTILRANAGRRFGIAPWSAHDLRRSALTGMARLGVAPIVLGHVANHRTTTRAGAGSRCTATAPTARSARRLSFWADYLDTIIIGVGAAAVVPMRRSPWLSARPALSQ